MSQVTPTVIRTLVAEPLTADAFAPFGVVLTPEGHTRLPINPFGDRLDIYREGFESDRPIEWFIAQFWLRERRVLSVERHLEITQAFIPLNGSDFLMVVARPNAPEENGLPALHEMRAFIVPGDKGIQLLRGTWHETPIPLYDGQVIMITNHAPLTRGDQSESAQKSPEAVKPDVEKRSVTEIGGFSLLVEIKG